MPWDNERTKRKYQYELLKDWQQQQDHRVGQFERVATTWLPYADNLEEDIDEKKPTAPMRDQYGFQLSPSLGSQRNYISQQEFAIENWLRYAQVRLALAAWRCDHQGYPNKLTALSPDYLASAKYRVLGSWRYYLDEAFSYHPDGLDLPVVLSPDLFNQNSSGRAKLFDSVIPANTPFMLAWKALPTERRYFQTLVSDGQDETKPSTTDPALGYFMGQPATNFNRSYTSNKFPEVYILGNEKQDAGDSDE